MKPITDPFARTHGQPRNSDRIDLVVDALRAYWKANPDLRLGQMVVNAAVCSDPFGFEDQVYYDAWKGAVAAPTPLPAPAPGMRVWYTYDDAGDGGKPFRCSASVEINEIGEGDTWDDWVVPDRIEIITDFRTGEVLWRRQ